MGEQRRRILVVVESGGRTRKLAITISESATVQDLANEIATTVGGQASFVLEINGGFELRNQDLVSVIGADEIVTARAVEESGSSSSGKAADSSSSTKDLPPPPASTAAEDDRATIYSSPPPYEHNPLQLAVTDLIPKRFQVRLVNPALARTHASQHPEDMSLPAGVLAFNGNWISGNTSLLAIKNEAARIFHWKSAINEQETECRHDPELACSCTIAKQIELNGLASMLHCSRQLMGRQCTATDCPYSHEAVQVPFGDSGCSLCWERLTSPCPNCSKSQCAECPLVQNTGCHHLFHAHCLNGPSNSTSTGCPKGCSKIWYPREMRSFTHSGPHILLVWDGDKIDRIPVPENYQGNRGLLEVPSSTIQGLVEEFLSVKGYSLANFGMRIHKRDPAKESVSFYNSTLVSICPVSAHPYPDFKRFDLFADKVSAEKDLTKMIQRAPQSKPNSMHIDLHTSEAPIVACGCTPLRAIFSDSDSDSECIILYVTQRRGGSNTDARPNKEANFIEGPEWHPEMEQTSRGISALLASLFFLSTMVPKQGVVAENKVLLFLFSMCRFPPAVRTLGRLFLNKVIEPSEKAALGEAMYCVLLAFCIKYKVPDVIRTNPMRTFEVARIFLAQLYSVAGIAFSRNAQNARVMEELSIVCPLTQKRLQDPVRFHDSMVEENALALYGPGGELAHIDNSIIPSLSTMSGYARCKFRQLLRQSKDSNATRMDALIVADLPKIGLDYNLDIRSTETDFTSLIDEANLTDMKMLGPLDVNSAKVIPPQLVLDRDGWNAVLTGKACGTSFLMPTSGERVVDVQRVAQELEPCIEKAKKEGTWAIDDYATKAVEPRSPDEAIMICLDLSSSMNSPSQVLSSRDHKGTVGSKQRYLTRLQLMVELFNIFVNRASSFESPTSLVIGLITFSTGIQVAQNLTPILENFLHALKNCRADGLTPLYDSLDKARHLLMEFGSKHPNMPASPHFVASGLRAHNVVVDSVQVGETNYSNLHAISACTGGYRFCPNQSLEDALCIFDLETMLDSGGRPSRKPEGPFPALQSGFDAFKSIATYPVDVITVDTFPKRAEHPKMKETVVPAKNVQQKAAPTNRLKRIMHEIQAWNADPHPAIDIYVNEEDITFMKIVAEAPSEGCPYSGGTFLLTCEFPETYPRTPPEIRFVTFILHPNVSKQGKICVAELGRLWSSDTTLIQALGQIYGLLLEPDLEDPTETHATLKYYDDDGTYALAAANAVKQHALQSRQQWRTELEGTNHFKKSVHPKWWQR